jgi:hypothetical protein
MFATVLRAAIRKESCPYLAETVQTRTLSGTINATVTYYPKSLKRPKKPP